MKPKIKYRTLREFVDSHPRTITQGEIAEKLGVQQTSLSNYLNKGTRPSPDVALRLHRDFGISLEGLLDPDGEVLSQ